jgi:hypothetical protein
LRAVLKNRGKSKKAKDCSSPGGDVSNTTWRLDTAEKKRGSLSRVKSTPKEEGGGDILNRPKGPDTTSLPVRTGMNSASQAAAKQELFAHCKIILSINKSIK